MKKRQLLVSFLVTAGLFLSSCEGKLTDHVNLIPQADSVEIQNGSFAVSNLKSIQCPDEWKATAALFADDLRKTSGLDVVLVQENPSVSVTKNVDMPAEAYKLVVTSGGVSIETADVAGLNHAWSTLHQLVLTAVDAKLPALTILDKPRFGYRGLMLDCSRHFWTVENLKETIDHLAFFKFSRLQMHLTDNNAWRLAMDKYPELTEKGTFYPDFPELSGKFYTKEDLKEIVKYAADRGIEIVPEVDLPGHAIALMSALPQLSCNGGQFEPYPEERALNKRRRGGETMICIGNPASLEFAEEVVETLAEIFPSRYIHLGGDEVPTAVWEKCPKCQALFKRENMKHPGELQDYFTRKLGEIVRAHGKVMVGWDEINDRNAATPQDMLTVWRDKGTPNQLKALERNIPVVMCPQHGCYFDWGYAGNSTRKVYEWDPVSEEVTADKLPLVKGGQAALWTERIATQDRVEWMLYPRMCAMAEVLWSPKDKRDWENFYERITNFYPVMEKLGINYYEDDAMNEKEFVPTEEKPALVRHAFIETNIPTAHPYHAEYAFDGKSNTFFWGGLSVGPEHYFTIKLGEPTKVEEIQVISGDSKDYITKADLLVTEDGENFVKVGTFNDLGEASAKLGGKVIKGVKIQITGQHTCWPILKEVILK